jgi:hypothetical protein
MNPDDFRRTFEEGKKQALKEADSLIARRAERLKKRAEITQGESSSSPCVILCFKCGKRIEAMSHNCGGDHEQVH